MSPLQLAQSISRYAVLDAVQMVLEQESESLKKWKEFNKMMKPAERSK
jgi:hypothetical protein